MPKGRPRFGNGRCYTPATTRAAEDAVAWLARAAGILLDPDHELAVELLFAVRDRRRMDVDNLAKLVLDALNGIAWRDDTQIAALTIRRVLDKEKPGTTVMIRRLGPWPPRD